MAQPLIYTQEEFRKTRASPLHMANLDTAFIDSDGEPTALIYCSTKTRGHRTGKYKFKVGDILWTADKIVSVWIITEIYITEDDYSGMYVKFDNGKKLNYKDWIRIKDNKFPELYKSKWS